MNNEKLAELGKVAKAVQAVKKNGLIPKTIEQANAILLKRRQVAHFENKHKTVLNEIELKRTKEISLCIDMGMSFEDIKKAGLYSKTQLKALDKMLQ